MKRTFLALLLLAFVTPVFALKPFSIWKSPKKYLRNFPLGTDQAKIYETLGTPKRTMDFGNKKIWVYEYGKGYGLRTLSIEFKQKIVIDVLYNDKGPYNGMRATQLQKNK